MRSLTDGVIVGLLLAQLFFCNLIALCGDVELNPGPNPKTSEMRQTRLTSKSGEGSGDRRFSAGGADVAADPTLLDVMKKLTEMDSNIDKKLVGLRDEVNATCAAIKTELRELHDEVADLRKENDSLKQENVDLRSCLQEMDVKIDDLECRSRRNNLLFYGLSRFENESHQDLEQTVQEFLTDRLELSESVSFDRVHRVSDRPNSPVIVRCCSYKDKITIMKAKGKLRGSKVFISEDFSLRVRSIRKVLAPHLKTAKQAGKRATMVFDHLIIDGKKFVLDDTGMGIKEMKQRLNK